ncbi:MAG: hypothetical protein DI537_10700 [Stutzerimonas stutzeri]|nr:MAG: hypothetical protein DI537_10700 [Stutzerimonas stutzeri]
MTTIAALTSIRNIALDRADACETVLAMNLHFGVAREVGRIINDLQHGLLDLAATAKAGWARIVVDDRATCDAEREGILSLIQDLRDLGITVVHAFARRPASKAAAQISLSLAA